MAWIEKKRWAWLDELNRRNQFDVYQ